MTEPAECECHYELTQLYLSLLGMGESVQIACWELARIRDVLECVPAPPPVELVCDLAPLLPPLEGIRGCICDIRSAVVGGVVPALQGVQAGVGRLAENSDALLGIIKALAGMDLGKLAGDAPDIKRPVGGTIGGAMAQAQLDAVDSMLAPGSATAVEAKTDAMGDALAAMIGKVEARPEVQEQVELLRRAEAGGWEGLTAKVHLWVKDWLDAFLFAEGEQAEAAIGTVWKRALKMYGAAVGLGVLAHGTSAALSVNILGFGGMRWTGLAAVIGKFAGFDPIIRAVQGTFYRAYLEQPMKYYMNEQFRPYIPAIQDLLRYRSKRILSDRGEFDKLMGYWGFSQTWADRIEDDLYTEPRHFELTIMGENDAIPDDWWMTKCLRMGYTEIDAAYMVGGIKRKIAGGYITGYVSQLQRIYGAGYMDEDELEAGLEDTGVNPVSREYARRAADLRRRYEAMDDHVGAALDQYNRAMIDEEDLEAELEVAVVDPARVRQMVSLARVRRFRRVYYTTPAEDAKKAVSTYRKAFVAGLVTASEYTAVMVEAGMLADVVDLRLDLDSAARDRTVGAEFRAYGLPRLRDSVLHGMIDLAGYRRELLAGGFPGEHVEDEVRLAAAMLERRRTQRVRTYQLPHYRRAYVLGLIDARTLRRVMSEAGLTEGEIKAAALTLERGRAAEAARRAEAARTAAAAAEAARQKKMLPT